MQSDAMRVRAPWTISARLHARPRTARHRLLFVTALLILAAMASAAEEAPPPGARAVSAEQPAPDRPLPLPPPLKLTGTFGEHRQGHLHTGIDLSTGGRCGTPVRAVAAGSIVRLRAGARGYGRALYLACEDGGLAVYGHLARFAPALETYLAQHQAAAGEFEVDLWPQEGRFAVGAGDTIAWSGDSGAGPPHLHFEYRRGETPLNPLSVGWQAPDTQPPRIGPVRLHALSTDGWVGGGWRWESDASGDTVAVRGTIGIEALCWDICETTDARLAPHVLQLWLDGELRFERRFEHLAFDRPELPRRVYGTLASQAGPWAYRLYRWPLDAAGEPTIFGPGDGRLRFDPPADEPAPVHTIVIAALDAAGNRSTRTLYAVAAPRPPGDRADPGPAPRSAEDGTGEFEIRVETTEALLAIEVRAAALRGAPPAAALLRRAGAPIPLTRRAGEIGESSWYVCPLTAVRGELIAVQFTGEGGAWRVPLGPDRFHAFGPQDGAAAVAVALGDQLTVCPGVATFCGTTILRARMGAPGDTLWRSCFDPDGRVRDPRGAETPSGLRALSPPVLFGPAEWPLGAELEVFFAPHRLFAAPLRDDPAWALYLRRGDGRWVYAGRRWTAWGLGGAIDALGCCALLVDERAPRIVDPSPPDGARLDALPELLAVTIAERGSGFDPRAADLWIDDRPVIAAWDVDAERLETVRPFRLTTGEHVWTVRVTDRAGLRAEARYRFEYRP